MKRFPHIIIAVALFALVTALPAVIAYLRYLLDVNGILGLRILSVHHSHMYLKLMADVRDTLTAGTFGEFYREFISRCVPSKKVLSARAAAKLER